MKVVFLDVDGVLVHQGTVERGRESGEPFSSSFYHAATVDPECVRRIKRIIDATGARIVVSSSWRRFDAQMTGLRRALIDAGFDRQALRVVLMGSTPYIHSTGAGTSERQVEVEAWLAAHPEVTRHLVIDDHPLHGHPQLDPRPDYFSGGILDAHVDEAIRILGLDE